MIYLDPVICDCDEANLTLLCSDSSDSAHAGRRQCQAGPEAMRCAFLVERILLPLLPNAPILLLSVERDFSLGHRRVADVVPVNSQGENAPLREWSSDEKDKWQRDAMPTLGFEAWLAAGGSMGGVDRLKQANSAYAYSSLDPLG